MALREIKTQILLIDPLLSAVMERRPTLKSIIDSYGERSLYEYSDGFKIGEVPTTEEYQQFVRIAEEETERILGKELAVRLSGRLAQNSAILTANHHGPEWLDITINGDLVFALPDILQQKGGIVPIFAFGDVPLNNLTWPIGIIVGERKIKLFPDSFKQTLVTHAPPLTPQHILKGKQTIEASIGNRELKEAALGVLGLFTDDVFQLPDFSSQATIINYRLWPLLFKEDLKAGIPEMVYIQMETVTARLITEYDLSNPNTLLHQILFNDELRRNILANLNGQYGCWDLNKLTQLIGAYKNREVKNAEELEKGSGTVFFWGVDGKGKRYPLTIIEEDGRIFLYGVTRGGEEGIRIPLEEEKIRKEINKKTIIPSLFTSFLTVAFQRGLRCYGGFMQVDYLTEMKRGLVKSFQETGLYDIAEGIIGIPTENYSTGMMIVLVAEGGKKRPAGTLDIIAGGGLSYNDLVRVGETSIRELNLLGLPNMYRVIYRPEEQRSDLAQIDEPQILEVLKDKLIELSL
jgi:hypothetical protein